MGLQKRWKCCVDGCNATNASERLFCMPAKDHLRNLWMSFLVPRAPSLLGLSIYQLLNKRVCARHFDKTQFGFDGVRLRLSYPCLFTEKEILHGIPLSTEEDYNVFSEHNYCCLTDEDPLGDVGDDDFREEEEFLLTNTSDVLSKEHQYTQTSYSEGAFSTIRDEEWDPLSHTTTVGESELTEYWKTAIADTVETRTAETKSVTVYLKKQLPDTTTTEQKPMNTVPLKNQPNEIVPDNVKDNKNTETSQKTREEIKMRMQLKNMEKLNPTAKRFLLSQLRLAGLKRPARRFTLEDKLFALTLRKDSPRAYRLLEKIFALPTKRTLARLSETLLKNKSSENI